MTTQLDGRYLSENERMKLLREEEECLGIQPLEYVSNALITARLHLHPPAAPQAAAPATSPSLPRAQTGVAEEVPGAAWEAGSVGGLATVGAIAT